MKLENSHEKGCMGMATSSCPCTGFNACKSDEEQLQICAHCWSVKKYEFVKERKKRIFIDEDNAYRTPSAFDQAGTAALQAEYSAGMTAKALADEHKVSKSTIRRYLKL